MPDPHLKSTTSLSIIVPAYNEQHLVAPSLDRLRLLGECPFLDRVRVIVVDDGSSDGTAASLEQFSHSVADAPSAKMEWTFIRHPSNQGKAAAIRTGLRCADTELTVIHDADLEYHPQDLVKMAKVFLQEPADAVFGSRFLAGDYRRVLFFRHEIGNRLLTLMSNIVSDLNLTDMETCYKMVRTELLKSIPLVGRSFEIEPEITIKLAKRAARIFEVPIRYSGRTFRKGKRSERKTAFAPLRRLFASLVPTSFIPKTNTAVRFWED
jgi:glycosyltransferase involved in cell wall biosynthesis